MLSDGDKNDNINNKSNNSINMQGAVRQKVYPLRFFAIFSAIARNF